VSPKLDYDEIERQKRCRLLFVIPSLRGGGAERVVVTLLKHLSRSKFCLSAALVDGCDNDYRDDIPSDVELINMGAKRVRYSLFYLIYLIWRLKPNVVFSTLGSMNLTLAILRPLLPDGVRYVARETTIVSQLPSAYDIPFWWFWAYRKFYKRFDTVICQSRSMQSDLVENFEVSLEKTCVINNPVDIEYIQKIAECPTESTVCEDRNHSIRLVAAGNLNYVKGFDLLIHAMAITENSQLSLKILGKGPLLEDLEQLVIESGLTERVQFVGFQKNPYAFFARADGFVLSSRFEGFPNVVLEALACGTPVIALPSPGGVSEILQGVAGCIVVDDMTPGALAKALDQFRGGYRMPRATVLRYSYSAILPRYEQVFLSHHF
jgi:glycosyltransferase involved in cell wall biosynthesis